jgi:hypothetical protein
MDDKKPREWNLPEADENASSREFALDDPEAPPSVSSNKEEFWNPFRHPICLSLPLRSGTASAWKEHIPFGMVLVDLVRPRVLVELGTHSGESYCAFCQAVQELRIATRCYAIDTWKGDPQTGFYGREVLDELRQHHDPLYGGFSRLIQSTFEDALEHFDDASIDLLHLDGYHTYEAVRQEFQFWLPKLSPRAVVVLHDTNVREKDFGVHRFWREMSEKYPSFEFPFCHGLGVLAVGDHVPKRLRLFLKATRGGAAIVNSFFHRLGQDTARRTQAAKNEAVLRTHIREQRRMFDDIKNDLKGQLREAEDRARTLEKRVFELEQVPSSAQRDLQVTPDRFQATGADENERLIRALRDQLSIAEAAHARARDEMGAKDRVIQELFDIIAQKDRALCEMTQSAAWSLVKTLRRLRLVFAPRGTRREWFWRKLLKWPAISSQSSGAG